MIINWQISLCMFQANILQYMNIHGHGLFPLRMQTICSKLIYVFVVIKIPYLLYLAHMFQ